MIGIYKITNLINNKIYIGQSTQINKRIYQHFYDAYHKNKNNNNYNTYFHKAIRKYGKDAFKIEIIEICPAEDLNLREQYWIKYYSSNINTKGYNLTTGGEGISTINRDNIYQLWDQGYSSIEIAHKLGYSQSGVTGALKAYSKYSIEEAHMRSAEKRKKKVNQYNLDGSFIQQFNSIKEASEALHLRADAISATCRGKQKTSGGFIWRFTSNN